MDRNETIIFDFSPISFFVSIQILWSIPLDRILFLFSRSKRRDDEDLNDMYMICRNFEIVPTMIGNRCSPSFFESNFFPQRRFKGKKKKEKNEKDLSRNKHDTHVMQKFFKSYPLWITIKINQSLDPSLDRTKYRSFSSTCM